MTDQIASQQTTPLARELLTNAIDLNQPAQSENLRKLIDQAGSIPAQVENNKPISEGSGTADYGRVVC